jgi:hypothetical protein
MLGLASLLFVASVVHFAYVIGCGRGPVSANAAFSISGGDNFMVLLRVGITVGLLLCVAGLALRKSHGVFASILGLVCVFSVYAWWRSKTLLLLRSAEVSDRGGANLHDLPLAAGLWGATWLDLFVLGAAVLLFVWQVAVLTAALRRMS